jgi:hypothetical protein
MALTGLGRARLLTGMWASRWANMRMRLKGAPAMRCGRRSSRVNGVNRLRAWASSCVATWAEVRVLGVGRLPRPVPAEPQPAAPYACWIRPISEYVRRETTFSEGNRYGWRALGRAGDLNGRHCNLSKPP